MSESYKQCRDILYTKIKIIPLTIFIIIGVIFGYISRYKNQKIYKKYSNFIINIYRKYLRNLGYSKHLSRYLFRIVQSGVYVAISLFLVNFINLYFNETKSIGEFGDFIGGILNPVFTFLMLIGLVATIVLQKTELSLARKEFSRSADALNSQAINLEYQRFENTFFKLISFLDDCRNNISYENTEDRLIARGRGAIKIINNNFIKGYINIPQGYNDPYSENYIPEEIPRNIKMVSEAYKIADANEFVENLDQYFRTLYNILKFIDNSDNIKNRNSYTNLLRAQLSRYELCLLFYNCLSEFGKEKMFPLVMKYEILKHLEVGDLIENGRKIWDSLKIYEK